MKKIKKVSVSSLPTNEGKIIDSFNTSDDKHTNAPSLNAVLTLVGTNPEIVTNTNGTAIKYDNGLMICYKELMLTMAVNSAWGSVYESGNISLGNFPVAFISPPIVSVTNAAKTGDGINGGWVEYIQSVSTTSCGTITMIRPSSANSATFKLNIIAIGMWK